MDVETLTPRYARIWKLTQLMTLRTGSERRYVYWLPPALPLVVARIDLETQTLKLRKRLNKWEAYERMANHPYNSRQIEHPDLLALHSLPHIPVDCGLWTVLHKSLHSARSLSDSGGIRARQSKDASHIDRPPHIISYSNVNWHPNPLR